MIKPVVLPYYGFGRASRVRSLPAVGDRLAGVEILILFLAGVLAAAAVAFLPLQLRIPGHAILKAALPMVLGIALVPRRWAGTISGLVAAGTVGIFSLAGIGNLQAAAVTALLAIGPAIDLAMIGAKKAGWQLYLRFGMAGLLANLLAFAVRWLTASSGLEGARPRMMQQLGWTALASFALCGILAGLISAVICFRGSAKSN